MPNSSGKKKKAIIFGIGLDSDGHKRVTTGPNFALVGGTEETHDGMTEKVGLYILQTHGQPMSKGMV